MKGLACTRPFGHDPRQTPGGYHKEKNQRNTYFNKHHCRGRENEPYGKATENHKQNESEHVSSSEVGARINPAPVRCIFLPKH